MNRPTDLTLQCPSCHLQSLGPVCGAAKRRINKNEKDEYFKAIDCTLWVERRIERTPDGIRRCPTCGQVIQEVPVPTSITNDQLIMQVNTVFPGATVIGTNVVSDPFTDTPIWEPVSVSPTDIPTDTLDWGISIHGISEMQGKVNAGTGVITGQLFPEQILPAETPKPKKQKRRSGDMPKGRISAQRRKRMEAENVVPDPVAR